jgi:hypothetical protein
MVVAGFSPRLSRGNEHFQTEGIYEKKDQSLRPPPQVYSMERKPA